jgi:hypothetical protein
VVPLTDFDGTNLQGSATQYIPLASRIDVSGYRQVDLMVRMEATTISAGTEIDIHLIRQAWTAQDPEQKFVDPSPLATVSLTSSDSAPAFKLASVTSGMGPMVAVWLGFQQASTPASLTANLSVELALRD